MSQERWFLLYSFVSVLNAGGLCDGDVFEEIPLDAQTEAEAFTEAKVKWSELQHDFNKYRAAVLLKPRYLFIRHQYTFKKISA